MSRITKFLIATVTFSMLFYLLFGSTLFFTKVIYARLPQLLKPYYLIRLAVVVLNIAIMTKILVSLVIKNEKLKNSLKNIVLCFYSFLLCFFILEGIFMFIPKSHNVGYTLSSCNWMIHYWEPINKFGYRDDDIDAREMTDKKKVFVLGDSLTAGYGIKNVKDRNSNLLEEKLPSNYKVFNTAFCALGTKHEANILVGYPLKPDILILQYYPNDIDGAAYSMGKRFQKQESYQNVSRVLVPIIRYSYLFNYIYWQYIGTGGTDSYMDYIVSSFDDRKIMEEHLSDLNKIVIFCKENNIPLIVVLFPFLKDLDTSERLLAPIEKFFIGKNIEVIKVADIINKNKIPSNRRVVHSRDIHPSMLIHKLLAEELYNTLIAAEMVK